MGSGNKERGGLSKREFAAKNGGGSSFSSGGGSFSSLKMPKAPKKPKFTDMGDLRTSLRSALNEAARARTAGAYEQLAPLTGGVPGSIGSVVNMIRSSISTPVENTFSDTVTAFSENNDRKQTQYNEDVRQYEVQQAHMWELEAERRQQANELALIGARSSGGSGGSGSGSIGDYESDVAFAATQEGRTTGLKGNAAYLSSVRKGAMDLIERKNQEGINFNRAVALDEIAKDNYSEAAFKKRQDQIIEDAKKGTYQSEAEYRADQEYFYRLQAEKTTPATPDRSSINWLQNPFNLVDQGMRAGGKILNGR